MSYLSNLFNLESKVVAITGAGGHLCSEMVRGFARAGCSVAILDLRLDKALAVEAELREADFQSVMSLSIDVTSKQQHVAALNSIITRFGKVDVLLNGAGINSPTPFIDISLQEWPHN